MFNELSRLNNAFEREVGVYQHCTPRLKGYQPAVYASSSEAPAWLLMEDLSHLLAGDQVVGLTYEQTLSAVRNMATIHAEFWMDSALEQHNWLPHHGLWFASPKQSVMEDFFATYGVRFGSEVNALYGAVIEQSDAINTALSQRKWTLIHGDLRADNLLFDANAAAPKSVILDWSWAARGHAAVDVAFLVGGSTPVAQREGVPEAPPSTSTCGWRAHRSCVPTVDRAMSAMPSSERRPLAFSRSPRPAPPHPAPRDGDEDALREISRRKSSAVLVDADTGALATTTTAGGA